MHFRSLQLVVLIGCSSLTLVGMPNANGSTLFERESLRDMKGIVLNPINFTSTPTNIEHDLPLGEFRVQVETEMRNAGIPLLDHESSSSSEVPHLQIQGAVSHITKNFYAYTIVIELHQEAALLRKTEQSSLVVTWSEGLLSTGDIQNFRDRLLLLARLFILDFQSVNTPSSQVWPLNGKSFTPAESI